MNLSVVLPAYSEAENLKKILPNLKEILDTENLNYEILVIDAMEKIDETEEICMHNNVSYYNRENGNNYGDAIKTGIKYAKNEYLLIMDADGSHNPKDISKLLKDCEKYDLTIGSRYVNGGKTENNIILIFMSYVVNVAYKILLGIKIKDISDSFRLYKTTDLKKLRFESNNFDIVEEILIKLCLENSNYKIREVPIVFEKRKNGKSKRKLLKFILSYISSISKLVKIKREKKDNEQ